MHSLFFFSLLTKNKKINNNKIVEDNSYSMRNALASRQKKQMSFQDKNNRVYD